MTLERNTIDQMTAAEKAFIFECIANGKIEDAHEVIKINMIQAAEKQARMASSMLSNPRRLASFTETVYELATQ